MKNVVIKERKAAKLLTGKRGSVSIARLMREPIKVKGVRRD